MRNRDLFDPGLGMEKFGYVIPDKHPGSGTLKSETKEVTGIGEIGTIPA